VRKRIQSKKLEDEQMRKANLLTDKQRIKNMVKDKVQREIIEAQLKKDEEEKDHKEKVDVYKQSEFASFEDHLKYRELKIPGVQNQIKAQSQEIKPKFKNKPSAKKEKINSTALQKTQNANDTQMTQVKNKVVVDSET